MRHCCHAANIVLNSAAGPRFAPFLVTDRQREELRDKRSDSRDARIHGDLCSCATYKESHDVKVKKTLNGKPFKQEDSSEYTEGI